MLLPGEPTESIQPSIEDHIDAEIIDFNYSRRFAILLVEQGFHFAARNRDHSCLLADQFLPASGEGSKEREPCMHLTPREQEKLLIYVAANLAKEKRAD